MTSRLPVGTRIRFIEDVTETDSGILVEQGALGEIVAVDGGEDLPEYTVQLDAPRRFVFFRDEFEPVKSVEAQVCPETE